MSNRRRAKMRPVRIEPYPGPAPRIISLGRPPDDSFGHPPLGQLDIWSPDGSDPPLVLVTYALKTQCAHCDRHPGLVWLGDDSVWRTVTVHDPSCPESVEQRGPVGDLIAVPDRELWGTS